jgi:hypothetical protein
MKHKNNFTFYPVICLKALKKTAKNGSHINPPSARHLNLGPPKQDAAAGNCLKSAVVIF